MLRLMSAFMGPIFAKEMVEIARRKRYYLNRVLYGLALLFTLFCVWESFRWRIQSQSSIKVMAELAEANFIAVSMVQYIAVFLLVPVFLCGVIAAEREERTLELLFTTALSDRQIILGKLGSRLVVLVLLTFCGLPIMSLIMFFGGIDPASLWRILAATLLAMLYAGAHSIYFSVTTKNPMGALVRTYWWMAAWILAVPLAGIIPLSSARAMGLLQAFAATLLYVNPVGPFIVALNPDAYQFMSGHIGDWFFAPAFVLPAGWSVFLIWRAVKRLRLAPTALGRVFSKIMLLFRRRAPGVEGVEKKIKRHRWGAERLWFVLKVRNPLWLRSRLTRVYDRESTIGRLQWAAWLVACCFILLFAYFEPRALSDKECSFAFLVPTWIAVALLTAIIAGSSLVGDRRRGFLDLVLLSPLSSGEIVDGTVLSVWQHLRRLYWLPVALCAFFCFTGSAVGWGCLCSLLTATLFLAVMIIQGTACSLTARTMPGALVPTFVFPLLMNFGIVFLLPIFETACGPALWTLSALFLVGTWLWVRRSISAAAVGCYFMAVHLLLTSLALCWTWSVDPKEYPVTLIHPGHLTIALLDGRTSSWFRSVSWSAVYICYWAALAVNLIWARWWLIRNFDRLVERPALAVARRKTASLPREKVPARPAVSLESLESRDAAS